MENFIYFIAFLFIMILFGKVFDRLNELESTINAYGRLQTKRWKELGDLLTEIVKPELTNQEISATVTEIPAAAPSQDTPPQKSQKQPPVVSPVTAARRRGEQALKERVFGKPPKE